MANLANLMEGGEFFTHPCSHACTASPTAAPHVHPGGAFVIIKDPTKTAFSPKAQVYMTAPAWSCSSYPLDKCIMVSSFLPQKSWEPPLPPTTAFPRISQLESHSTYIDFS